jgi:hypothetical protein
VESKYLTMSISISHRSLWLMEAVCKVCSAWCAERPGRNPYEQERKSCSYTASSTMTIALCANLSSKVGMWAA